LPKERLGVNLAIWLPIIKNWNCPWFPCVKVACDIPLEISHKGYNFSLELISIGGLHTKLWAPKVVGDPTLGISRLPLETFETKWHLNVGPVTRHKVYYKGEGGGFPQVQAILNLVSLWLPVARPCTKVLQLHINQHIVWFMQVCVSNWVGCQSS
jgi:hypothetical protein